MLKYKGITALRMVLLLLFLLEWLALFPSFFPLLLVL